MVQTCDRCGREEAIFVIVNKEFDFEEYLCIKCFFEEKAFQERRLKQKTLNDFFSGRC